MVLAEDAAAAGQGVLVQLAGLGVAAHVPQRPGQGRGQPPACSRGHPRAGRASAGANPRQGHGRCGYRRGPAGTQHALQAIQRRPGLPVAARSAASRCGISCAHRGHVTGLPGSPGSAAARIASVRSRVAAAWLRGEPVPQDGLGEPVHHQAALVDPGQRLPGQVGQGLPPGQRISRPGGQLAGQFAGSAGEQVFRDRLGGQERAQAGQLGGGRVVAGRAGPRSAGSRRPATAGRTTPARPGPAASRPGSPAGPGTGRQACRSRP